jgi:hypothetical protein
MLTRRAGQHLTACPDPDRAAFRQKAELQRGNDEIDAGP